MCVVSLLLKAPGSESNEEQVKISILLSTVTSLLVFVCCGRFVAVRHELHAKPDKGKKSVSAAVACLETSGMSPAGCSTC